MALVTCPDCGKKFSDKVPNCPECSCPIEYAIKDNEQTVTVINSEIIGKYNILGREFILNKSLLISLILKVEIRNMEVSIENASTEFYHTFRSIDELIEKLPEFISSEIDGILESTIDRLIIFKIYDLDKEAFFKKYYFDKFNAEPIMSDIIEKYLDILKYEAELSQYREYIKQIHRNRWSGGGFGIAGAIKGSIKAQLLNIGTGFLYSLPENTQRANDEYEINRRKRELFEDPNTLISVSKAIKITGMGIISSFIMELESRGVIEKYNYQTEIANSILNNYIRNNISLTEEVKIKMLQDAFFADPSSYKVYLNILWAEFGDKGDVRKLAEILGYISEIEEDIEKYKNLKIEKLKEAYEDELDWIYEKSCEELNDNKLLFEVLDKCLEISKKINHFLYDEIMLVVKNRIKCGINISDARILKKYINDISLSWGKEIDVTDLTKLIDDAEKVNDREIVWNEIKKDIDNYKNVCRFSVVYLLEVFYKAIRDDIAAQDVVFMYLFGDKCDVWSQKEVDKYYYGLETLVAAFNNVYWSFDEYNGTKTELEESSFYNLLYSIGSIFSGDYDDGIEMLNEIKEDCPLAYYFLSIINKDNRLKYLEIAAKGGSYLALKHYVAIVDKEYSIQKEQMYLSVGIKNIDSLWFSSLRDIAIYGYGDGGDDYGSYESYFIFTEHLDEISEGECETYIKKIDNYLKDRYRFYTELLKNGNVRYLMNDDLENDFAYSKRSYYLTFFEPLEGNILSSHTLWEIRDAKSNIYLCITNKGLMYCDGKNFKQINYNDYKVDSIQWDMVLKAFNNNYGIRERSFQGFIEELIAIFRYYYIREEVWINLDFDLKPCDEVVNIRDDFPMGREIEDIISLLKDNKFLLASEKAYMLSKGDIDTIAYALYAAILKVAREKICEDWFEKYIKLLESSRIECLRSDIALECGRIRNLLESKKILRNGEEFRDSYSGYLIAAEHGRKEAVEFIATLCENRGFCSHKEWGDIWRKRIVDSPINRFNIFDTVEQEWINAGNEKPASLHKVIPVAIGEKPLYPYYGYEDVNKSNHWYILLQFSKIFNYYDNNILSGIYKGTGVGKGNKELESNIRQYYGIPQNEIIYIMQDATILNKKFYKGVIFTDKALYVRNSSLIKIEWKNFTKSDFSFGILNYTIRGQKFEMPNPEGKIKWLLDYLSKNVDKNVIDRCEFLKISEKLDLDKCYEDSFFSGPQ